MVDVFRGIDDVFVLIIEVVLKLLFEFVMDMGCEVLDILDIGVGFDFMEVDDCGCFFGKSVFINVRSLVGLIIRYGWILVVFCSEVIDFVGNSLVVGICGLVF